MTAALATSCSSAVSRDAAVALVDSGLSCAAHRDFFTHDEATQLLTDVRDRVGDVGLSAAVASMVNDAVVSYGNDRLIGRCRVVDALLDIRLALTRPPARADGVLLPPVLSSNIANPRVGDVPVIDHVVSIEDHRRRHVGEEPTLDLG